MSSSCTPMLNVIAAGNEVDNIILNTFWLGALAPITIALIFTSSHLWKKPVFVLNMCAIACTVTFGTLALTNEKDILFGRPGSIRRIQALVLLSYLIPIFTQSILFLRTLAVYPPRLLPWKRNLLIYGVLAVVLAARIINIALYLHQVIVTLNRSGDMFSAWKSPFVRADWILQLFYVAYTSTLFLLRLHRGGALTLRPTIRTSVPVSITIQPPNTYVDRLRALFWIAVFNFVFPAILDTVAIIIIFFSSDPWLLADLVTSNLYLELVFVLLATIWCSGKYWEPEKASHPSESSIEFKATVVASTLGTSGILTSQATAVFIGQGGE